METNWDRFKNSSEEFENRVQSKEMKVIKSNLFKQLIIFEKTGTKLLENSF